MRKDIHAPKVEGIAMAVVRSGTQRMGQKIYASLVDGRYVAATVCSPVFYDPEGKRLHA